MTKKDIYLIIHIMLEFIQLLIQLNNTIKQCSVIMFTECFYLKSVHHQRIDISETD